MVDNLILDTLWAEFPECYDELSISSYRLLLGTGQRSHMGRTAGNHIFQNGKIKTGNDDLGHITDDFGNFPGRDLFDVLIIYENLAFVKRHQVGTRRSTKCGDVYKPTL